MQLTGDRFTQQSAVFGNDLVTLPNFPAEIRAPRAPCRACRRSRSTWPTTTLTLGDAPDVLVAMNPAALKANLGDLPGARRSSSTPTTSPPGNLSKAGYDASPLDALGDGPAGRIRRAPGRPDRDDRRGGQAVRPVAQGRRALERIRLRLACCRGMYGRPTDPTVAFLSSSKLSPTSRRQRSRGVQGSLELGRPPAFGGVLRSSRPRWRRAPTATSPATWPGLRPDRRRRPGHGLPVPGLLPITPASDILHELSKRTRRSACTRSRPRTRSPHRFAASAPPSVAPWP